MLFFRIFYFMNHFYLIFTYLWVIFKKWYQFLDNIWKIFTHYVFYRYYTILLKDITASQRANFKNLVGFVIYGTSSLIWEFVELPSSNSLEVVIEGRDFPLFYNAEKKQFWLVFTLPDAPCISSYIWHECRAVERPIHPIISIGARAPGGFQGGPGWRISPL